ncbi:hypothetical protein [Nonomuraea sp. NPDC001023]|uniref:hypothetical protein n=1 Tax=unclassified Nonomuraea TaxID=2593643 RepID=UPI003326FBE6
MIDAGMRPGQVWRLFRGEIPIGEIHVADADFPWLNGRFVAGDGFENVRHLFEAEFALIDHEGELDVEAWELAYKQITDAITLVKADGTPVAEFMLHIKDTEAWFRWSDEPFDTHE